MNILQVHNICVGCGACEALCPSAAIAMQPDEHGFLYPTVDSEKCTDCGLCTRKCPAISQPQTLSTDVFAGYAKDEKLLCSSSSGAIFPILAGEVIRRGGTVFGAAFDERFEVKHTAAESLSELPALCGSKYVQSRIDKSCYEQVKEKLSEGEWVYFSGTPCQIAALKNYLGQDYDTLITQGLACHSVPSPMVWRNYVGSLEQAHDSKLSAFSFRSKTNGWEGYSVSAEFENGSAFVQPTSENAYQRGFIKGLFSRNSCFNCKFKGLDQCSDITLTDFWGVKNICPEAYNPMGTSLILIRSEKGAKLLNECSAQAVLTPVDKNSAFAFNTAVLTPIKRPEKYRRFWQGYGETDFEKLVFDCCKPLKKERLKSRLGRTILVRAIRRLRRM